jgi:hypothetical protein
MKAVDDIPDLTAARRTFVGIRARSWLKFLFCIFAPPAE